MIRPIALVKQYICEHVHTHERDWDDCPDRCKYCLKPMPLDPDRSYVGLLRPDSGD